MLPGWKMGVHAHSFYEANVLLEGAAVYASEPPQRLAPGHLVFYSPHTPHAWGTPDCECLRLVLWFQVEPDITVPMPPAWPCWLEQLDEIARLLAVAEAAAPGWPDQAAAWLGVLISRLLTLGAQPVAQTHETHLIGPIDSALQFIEDNLDRPLSLTDIAAHAGMSVPHLTRTFKRTTGESVLERLINLRMDCAAVLLTETDAPLISIARQVGMPDVSYFCRRFHRHYNATPMAYRQTVLQDMGQ